MSDIVKNIRTGLESVITDVLGSEWNPLQYKYDLEKNPTNTSKRWGVVVGDGVASATGRIGDVTIDRTFTVTLGDEHVNQADDSNAQTVQDSLETLLDDIFIQAALKKLGVPNLVYSVTISSISEPLLVVDGTLFMQATYIIKYRSEAFRC